MEVALNILLIHPLFSVNLKNSSMDGINLKTHNDRKVSIKDLLNNINLSQFKWDFLFNSLFEISDAVYFGGQRLYFKNQEFDETISFLSEKILYQDNFTILFKLNASGIVVSRNLVSKLWLYYEYPAIFFLKDNNYESELVILYKGNNTYESIIAKTSANLLVLYQSFEQDVLWIQSNQMRDLDTVIQYYS
jgi:hypothetical protein